MIEGIPRISVLVITYNQKDVISRAIESLLAQKDYIFEICVSDDCSKDGTWDILQEYSAKYPGLFVLNRNEPNVGIFENIEKTWTMPMGDVIYQLSGDDECGEGWFEKVVNFIRENNIDYKNELFCIYGDFKCIYPNGDSCVIQNKRINSNRDTIKLATKGRIFNRSSCYSRLILNKYVKVSQGRSYMVEEASDRQLQMFTEKNYYIPYVGNKYYARIGISSNMSTKILSERSNVYTYFGEFLNSQGFKMSRNIESFFKYKSCIANRKYLRAFWFWLNSMDFSLKDMMAFFRLVLFALMRRIPHNKYISDFKI